MAWAWLPKTVLAGDLNLNVIYQTFIMPGNMYMTYPTVRHLEKFLKNCATAEKRLYFECVS